MENECIYCFNLVTEVEPVPAVAECTMWEAMAPEHDPDCEWIVTRAHRYFGDADIWKDPWGGTTLARHNN